MSKFLEFIEDTFAVDIDNEEQMDAVALWIERMLSFRKIGRAAVDSGQIMIVDPCYVGKGFDYDAMLELWKYNSDNPPKELAWKLGVVVDSGGDGQFPVYAMRNSNGKTLAAMIVFSPDALIS